MTKVNELEAEIIGVTISLLMRGPTALPVIQSWLLSHYGINYAVSDVVIAKMDEMGYTVTIEGVIHITNEGFYYEAGDEDTDDDDVTIDD